MRYRIQELAMWRCPTSFRLWKYITTSRRSASTCTFGEAMCGVLVSTARTVDVTGGHRYQGVRQGMKTGTSRISRRTGGVVTETAMGSSSRQLEKPKALEPTCLRQPLGTHSASDVAIRARTPESTATRTDCTGRTHSAPARSRRLSSYGGGGRAASVPIGTDEVWDISAKSAVPANAPKRWLAPAPLATVNID